MTKYTKRITFVIGGARSGKSAFALARASEMPGNKVFIATAQAYDGEMQDRIRKHQLERGDSWVTIEEPLYLGRALESIKGSYEVLVVDCLTLWLSNLMMNNGDIENETEAFLNSLSDPGGPLFAVSNEVGMGIVPENELARKFRDLAGRLNQQVAALADEVYLVAAGIPLKIK